MKIIAIEGLDKAGKHTATEILTNYFTSKDLNVKTASFPDYTTPTGKLVHDWLKGKFDADTKTFELLQAADKQYGQAYIQTCEDDGTDILLIDRYVHSEWAYGAYDNDDRWLQELTRYMRLPDFVLYLDVEPEVSMHRRGKYGDDDRYESNLERLRYTRSEYECLFQEKADIIAIRTVNANTPALIVKSRVLEIASELYERYTGIPILGDEVLNEITEEEAKMLQSWNISNEDASPVNSAKN